MWRDLASPKWCQMLGVMDKGLLLELVIMANYDDFLNRRNGVLIKRGQLATSAVKLADRLKTTPKAIRYHLEVLKKVGTIEVVTSNAGLLITICNYNEYQKSDAASGNAVGNAIGNATGNERVSAKGNAAGQHKKEIKNNKNKRTKEIISLSSPVGDDTEKNPSAIIVINPIFVEIGTQWFEFAQKEMPWKKAANWNAQAFASEIERVCRIMNLNLHGIEEIFKFISKDDFWRKNAVSPFGLLKKSSKNDLRKIDNIITRMRTKQHRVDEALQRFVDAKEGEYGGKITEHF